MKTLRVLALIDDVARTGGGERMVRHLMSRLDPERFERVLCSSRWSAQRDAEPAAQAVVEELEESGVRFIGLPRRSTMHLSGWGPLVELIRREGVDILHCHMFGSNAWGALFDILLDVPVFVAQEQTWSYEGHPMRRFVDRELISRRADAFVAVSEADRRRMIEVEGVDPDVTVVIPNAVPAPPPTSGRDVRSELDIQADAPVIGTVCSLRPQKALHVLIRAAAILRREFPSLRTVIVGDGSERATLEALIAELGLDGCVLMVGDRADVPDWIQGFDVAVCSSDFEGTPLSIMEYMERAKPVVATMVGGVPEVVEDGEQGLLVEPGDPPALASSIAELLREPDRAREMGARGRERRRKEFDIEVAVHRFERLYERLHAASTQASMAG